MRPVIVILMVFLNAAFSLMVEAQEDSEKEIRSLHGTMITMINETEGIASEFWAKGSDYRSETTIGDRTVISLQFGNKTYTYAKDSDQGDLRIAKRGLGSMPYLAQTEEVKRFGRKTGTATIEGEVHDIYQYDVNAPDEMAVAYINRSTGLPRLWISSIRTGEAEADVQRLHFRNLEKNVEIPDQMFVLPSNVRFNSSTPRDVDESVDPSVEQTRREEQEVSAEVKSVSVVTATDVKVLKEGQEIDRLQVGEIVPIVQRTRDRVLVKTRHGEGWVAREDLVRLDLAESFFDARLEAKPNDTTTLLGRARLFFTMADVYTLDAETQRSIFRMSLLDLNRLVALRPEDAEVLRMRAKVAFRLQLEDKALADYEALIRMDKNDADAHSHRCFLLGINGQFEEAMLECNLAIDLDDDVASFYLHRGVVWEAQEQNAKAEADYNTAIRLGDQSALRARAMIFLKAGEFEKALKDLGVLLEANPEQGELYLLRSKARYNARDIEGAFEDVNAVLNLAPDNAEAFDLRARIWSKKGDFQRAVEDASKAIQLAPVSPELHRTRADLRYGMHDYQKAIEDYDIAIAMEPSAEAYMFRGVCYYSLGKYEQSVKDLDEAIKREPARTQSYLFRGSARNHLNDSRGAVEDFSRVLEFNPQYAEVYLYRATAWDRLGESEKAFADYNRVIELDGTSDVAFSRRATYWQEKGEYAKAIADWEKALQLAPRDEAIAAEFAKLLGRCPDKQFRDPDRAIELAERACELTGWKDYRFLMILSAVYAEAGDLERARTWAKKCLEVTPAKGQEPVKKILDDMLSEAQQQ